VGLPRVRPEPVYRQRILGRLRGIVRQRKESRGGCCSALARRQFAQQPLLAFAKLADHAAHFVGLASEPVDLSAKFADQAGRDFGRSFAWRTGSQGPLADLRRKLAEEPFDLLADLFGLLGQAGRAEVLHRRPKVPDLYAQVGRRAGPLAFPRTGKATLHLPDFTL
jgi:hypothetical protein